MWYLLYNWRSTCRHVLVRIDSGEHPCIASIDERWGNYIGTVTYPPAGVVYAKNVDSNCMESLAKPWLPEIYFQAGNIYQIFKPKTKTVAYLGVTR